MIFAALPPEFSWNPLYINEYGAILDIFCRLTCRLCAAYYRQSSIVAERVQTEGICISACRSWSIRPKIFRRREVVLMGFRRRGERQKAKKESLRNLLRFIGFWRRARDSNPRSRFDGLHDFQSCSFDQLGQLSVCSTGTIILYGVQKIKCFFKKLSFIFILVNSQSKFHSGSCGGS